MIEMERLIRKAEGRMIFCVADDRQVLGVANPLDEEEGLANVDSHIEHFCPQSDPSIDPHDYSNMLCSCQNQLKKGEPRHCGNLKDDWIDPALLVSPLTPSCEDHFAFTGDGLFLPKMENDYAAAKTLSKLGLDLPKLIAMRAKVVDPFLEDGGTQEEVQHFVTGYLNKDMDGYLGEFWTTIRHLFGGFVVA